MITICKYFIEVFHDNYLNVRIYIIEIFHDNYLYIYIYYRSIP